MPWAYSFAKRGQFLYWLASKKKAPTMGIGLFNLVGELTFGDASVSPSWCYELAFYEDVILLSFLLVISLPLPRRKKRYNYIYYYYF